MIEELVGRVYKGTPHDVFMRQCMRYDTPPEKMTPLELLKWGIEVDGWVLTEDAIGIATWFGPAAHAASPGMPFSAVRDPDLVFDIMMAHYKRWFVQRNAVLQGLALFNSPAPALMKLDLCGACSEQFVRINAKMRGADPEKAVQEWQAELERRAAAEDAPKPPEPPKRAPRKRRRPKADPPSSDGSSQT